MIRVMLQSDIQRGAAQPTLNLTPWSLCLAAYCKVQPQTALITTDQVPIYTRWWRERQFVLTPCPRMLSSNVASVGFERLCRRIMRTLCTLYFPTISSRFRIQRCKHDGIFISNLCIFEWDYVTVLVKIGQGRYGSALRALAADCLKKESFCRDETICLLWGA